MTMAQLKNFITLFLGVFSIHGIDVSDQEIKHGFREDKKNMSKDWRRVKGDIDKSIQKAKVQHV